MNGSRDFQRLQQKGQSHSFAESRSGGGAGLNGRPLGAQRGNSFAAAPQLSSTKMPTLNELNEVNFKMDSRGASGVTGATDRHELHHLHSPLSTLCSPIY